MPSIRATIKPISNRMLVVGAASSPQTAPANTTSGLIRVNGPKTNTLVMLRISTDGTARIKRL
jgi:hypothetical protein